MRSSLLGKTATLIALLDVRPGDCVLEVDPIHQASTEELLSLVGSAGRVMSLSAAEVDRCALDHFDRLVVWSTAPLLPARWIERLGPGGLGVVAVPIAPLAGADGAVLVQVDGDGVPEITSALPGGLLAGTLDVPRRFVDSTSRQPDGRLWWLSGEWLRGRPEDAAVVMGLLAGSQHNRQGPLSADEDVVDLAGYLLARRPDGMITVGFGDSPPAVGCALPSSVAVLSNGQLVVGGTDEAAAGLLDWIEEWRGLGRPGLGEFHPYLVDRQSYWEVRFELV